MTGSSCKKILCDQKRSAPALFAHVLREASACGIGQIAFTGGEATLHSRFPELVSLTAEAGLDFGLVTNGLSLPKHLDALREREFNLDWRDDDHFACWYCAKRFGGVDWIRARPDHPWHKALTGVVPPAGDTPTDSQDAVA